MVEFRWSLLLQLLVLITRCVVWAASRHWVSTQRLDDVRLSPSGDRVDEQSERDEVG